MDMKEGLSVSTDLAKDLRADNTMAGHDGQFIPEIVVCFS